MHQLLNSSDKDPVIPSTLNHGLRLAWVITFVGLLVSTLFTLLGGPIPLLDQVVHFQFYLALGWTGWVLLFLTLGRSQAGSQLRRAAMLCALAGAGWHGHVWAGPLKFHPAPAADGSAAEVLIMWANVQHGETHIQNLLDLVAKRQPDVIGLGEAVACEALDQLLEQYPYSVQDLATGLVLCSRLPLQGLQMVPVPKSRPILTGVLQLNGTALHINALHALWPTEPAHLETIFKVAEIAADHPSCLFMGDWNTTPWARGYLRLLANTHLWDVRQGAAPWATWRSKRGSLLRLPIDHVFIQGDVVGRDFEIGPDFGSDHFPIFAKICL
ncbi:MAG: endonuclease/exonuclease/phosphatase family protein [Planctomycetes bacterium]|nr:endonuclease/exonuclease/phosphatase family protein [Planctomycetota bacterium]